MAISKKQLEEVCKKNQAENCCRYLTIDASGWVCAKLTPLKSLLDRRVAEGKMRAKGDNCEGLDPNNNTN